MILQVGREILHSLVGRWARWLEQQPLVAGMNVIEQDNQAMHDRQHGHEGMGHRLNKSQHWRHPEAEKVWECMNVPDHHVRLVAFSLLEVASPHPNR